MSHGEKPVNTQMTFIFWVLALAVILGAVIGGFSVYGGPLYHRALRIDNHRIRDLSRLSEWTVNYYRKNGHLPAGLADLSAMKPVDLENPADPLLPVDPESKKPYHYEKVNPTSYTLCAKFSTEAKPRRVSSEFGDGFSSRVKGLNCFTYAITESPSFNQKRRNFYAKAISRQP